MKKAICFALSLALILAASSSVIATDNDLTALSEFSDIELLQFLDDNNINVPTVYKNASDSIPFVRTIIERLESGSSMNIRYECYALMEFSNNIQVAVKNYYCASGVVPYSTSTSNILIDNVVYGAWSYDYLYYNCFGYAIGIEEWLHPGISLWLANNNDMETYEYNGYANMQTLTSWIQSDLEYYGYTVNAISTSLPNVQVTEHTKIICFRKDLHETLMIDRHGLYELNHDYHFMRLDQNGNWYHKPGATNPLRYKYVPSNSRVWVSEWYDGNAQEYGRDTSFAYEGDIYFFQYSSPHQWTQQYYGIMNGSHCHISVCTVCGETNGAPMSCVYPAGSNTCRICGHNKDTAVNSLGLSVE